MARSAKRDELRSKIERAQERQAKRGGSSIVRVANDFVARRPFTALAGSVAFGAVIGVMLRGRILSANTTSKAQKIGKSALLFGLKYAEQAYILGRQKTAKAADKAEATGEAVADKARELVDR